MRTIAINQLDKPVLLTLPKFRERSVDMDMLHFKMRGIESEKMSNRYGEDDKLTAIAAELRSVATTDPGCMLSDHAARSLAVATLDYWELDPAGRARPRSQESTLDYLKYLKEKPQYSWGFKSGVDPKSKAAIEKTVDASRLSNAKSRGERYAIAMELLDLANARAAASRKK